jgi:hypothetical protein
MRSVLRVALPVVVATGLLAAPAIAHADTVWLCRPGADPNPCTGSLKTTVRYPAKPPKVVTPRVPAKPPIDCFYVYPTVSEQATMVSDLAVEPAQTSIARYQAARFSQVCNVYAPMYRQITLRALFSGGAATQADRDLGYSDVKAAFEQYRAENPGRGFVLIGHSQGSGVLKRLIREHIEPDPDLRSSMVSGLLLGSSVAVPVGKTVGGDFSSVPVCTRAEQINCVISYASFSEKPPEGSLFGRVRVLPGSSLPPGVDYEAACTNPAALKGGWAKIETIQPSKRIPGLLGAAAGLLYRGKPPTAKTPWLTPKDRYKAKCVRSNGTRVLMVKGIGDARKLYGSPTPGWGLHLLDVNLPLGDLIDVVRDQGRAYTAR